MIGKLINTNNYYTRLDFLRFFAVGLVICQHWFFIPINKLEIGSIGVIIFFVLSGFLITGILLNNKEKIEKKEDTIKSNLYNFYIRRSIRIFPIYFLLIFILFFFKYSLMRENFWWFFTYSSNILTYVNQKWVGPVGPLWSLAVEEQFYLVWPMLIFLIPVKRLKGFLILCIVLGPVFRILSMLFAQYYFEVPNLKISSMVLMPCNLDAFAIGGLLAFEIKYQQKNLFNRWVLITATLSLVPLYFFSHTFFHYLMFTSIFSVLSYFLIRFLVSDKEQSLDGLFHFPLFIFLGKISYGIYLYHGPFHFLYAIIGSFESKVFQGEKLIFQEWGTFLNLSKNMSSLINVLFLFLICILSWYMIEKPINGLKKHFEYSKK